MRAVKRFCVFTSAACCGAATALVLEHAATPARAGPAPTHPTSFSRPGKIPPPNPCELMTANSEQTRLGNLELAVRALSEIQATLPSTRETEKVRKRIKQQQPRLQGLLVLD